MVVALTVTPALCLLLLANGAARAPRVAAGALAAAWLRARADADHSRRAAAFDRHGGRDRCVGLVVLPLLGESLFPDFKERDFLMHWITKPGTSHRGEVADRRRAASQELRAIPGVRNFGSHIGQALLADEIVGRQLRRELDQHRSGGRL